MREQHGHEDPGDERREAALRRLARGEPGKRMRPPEQVPEVVARDVSDLRESDERRQRRRTTADPQGIEEEERECHDGQDDERWQRGGGPLASLTGRRGDERRDRESRRRGDEEPTASTPRFIISPAVTRLPAIAAGAQAAVGKSAIRRTSKTPQPVITRPRPRVSSSPNGNDDA